MARRGKHVVRLKCGDPFVLGRGGEEALAIAKAGIRVDIVPGITTAVAVTNFTGTGISGPSGITAGPALSPARARRRARAASPAATSPAGGEFKVQSLRFKVQSLLGLNFEP